MATLFLQANDQVRIGDRVTILGSTGAEALLLTNTAQATRYRLQVIITSR